MQTLADSEIVAEADLEAIRAIADEIVDSNPIALLTEPTGSMIMVRHVDPLHHTAFYLGEAHVTECEVDLNGTLGYGCVLGDNPERALCAAILDAAALAKGSDLSDRVARRLAAVGETLRQEREDASRRVAATRVDFDLK